MSIKDVEKLNVRLMETLHRKKENEISRIENGHKELKVEIKNANEGELVEIRNENSRKVVSENQKKEKVLEQMKVHLDQTAKMTDTQIKDLKTNTIKVKNAEHEKLSMNRDRVKADNDLYLEDLGHRLSKEQKILVEDNQEQLEILKNVKGQEYSETQGRLQTKLNNQNNVFTQKFQTDGLKQTKIKTDQDNQFKKERMDTHVRQSQDMDKLIKTHNTHLETRDKTFRKGIKEQDLVFERKYGESLQVKNDDLKRLEDLNKTVLSKMKGDLKTKLEATVNRSDDPFYQFIELKPTLKEYEDRVEIKVEIPEHAKTDVQLTLHGKEAIINFNRRYDDTRKEAGTSQSLHKVESFSTRLMTSHHLDQKSVKASYADGVMTYVVKRA